MDLTRPRIVPPLDPDFSPAVLCEERFREEAAGSSGEEMVIALERPDGAVSRFQLRILRHGHPQEEEILRHAERVFKFLLWQRGGHRAYIGGPRAIGERIEAEYSAGGRRGFDARLMERIYDRPLEIIPSSPEDVPAERKRDSPLGGHLDGCRIGFDLGASDIKVAALIDGEPVFSEEIVWEPSTETDPAYHRRCILSALRMAAERLPRVDAIGGSAAGVYVDNRVRVASLFRSVPPERYEEVRDIFLSIAEEIGAPLVIVNDGDVAALAGSLSLHANAVLGIALGSSEAAGYVNESGYITGWLNELAFTPIDYSPRAPVEEWSGDRGCGASYLSQQGVFRLAERAGFRLPREVTNAERLKFVQERLEAGEKRTIEIWETIGVYLGYSLAHYAAFYDLEHVLLLGRVTSGSGGRIILGRSEEVLRAEFPSLAARVRIHLPEEAERRVGQAIAAASLPVLS